MSNALKITVAITCLLFGMQAVAQIRNTTAPEPQTSIVLLPPMADSIVFNPFYAEDSLSEAFSILLNHYFKYGKFEKPYDAFSGKQGRVFFQELFTPNAMVVNDLGKINGFMTQLPIAQYVNQASTKRPPNYEFFVEKGLMVVAYADTVARNYVAEYPVFKLFADKAVYRNPYELGAIYTIKVRINLDSFDIKIEDVVIKEGHLFQNFSLGGFGFQGDSPLLLTNNLNGLVRSAEEAIDPNIYQKKDTKMARISDNSKPKKKPKSERVSTITKSNINFKAGLLYPDMFKPNMIPQNTNDDATIRTSQGGESIGIAYQKTVGKKDGFGWFIGVNYNRLDFKSTYENLGMIYTQDPIGSPLFDLEGNAYAFRHVQVPTFTDVGYLSYVTPEFGLLFNIHLGAGAHFQISGSISHNTMIENTSITTGVVSYQGQMTGDSPLISQDNLGFYTNREVEWNRPFDEFQNFMAYHAGLSLNIMMGERMSIFAEGRYNSSMTYAIRQANNKDLPFFDLGERSWKSPMNFLPESRNFKTFSLSIGLRFYLNEKR